MVALHVSLSALTRQLEFIWVSFITSVETEAATKQLFSFLCCPGEILRSAFSSLSSRDINGIKCYYQKIGKFGIVQYQIFNFTDLRRETKYQSTGMKKKLVLLELCLKQTGEVSVDNITCRFCKRESSEVVDPGIISNTWPYFSLKLGIEMLVIGLRHCIMNGIHSNSTKKKLIAIFL